MQFAPSKNPEKESKQFATVALVSGIVSLFIWFVGIVALGTGIRGIILSSRVKNNKYLALSIIGTVLGLLTGVYYFAVIGSNY